MAYKFIFDTNLGSEKLEKESWKEETENNSEILFAHSP